MIELKNVSKFYNSNGNVTVGLRKVSLSFKRNEIVAITGASGSGKSTLLNVICGVDTYEEGEIYIDGNETSYFNQQDMDEFRKKYVSFIYQNYNIIESYTVLENVMLPLIMNGEKRDEAKTKALELIKKVGLENRIKNKGTELSGGEKQRTVIARALATDAPILACDEPTGNLDAETGKGIIKLLKEVAKDKLVLIVTHNYEQCKDIVTRTIKLHDGEIIEDYNNTEIIDCSNSNSINIDSISKKTSSGLTFIALNNIKSTPKKNTFSMIVLLVLAFSFLFLVVFSMYLSDISSTNSSKYSNTLPERTIVYATKNKELDEAELASISEGYKNAFYEDFIVSCSTSLANLYGTFTQYTPKNITNIVGSYPNNEDDVFIVFSSKIEYDYMKELALDTDFRCDDVVVGKLCGFGYHSSLKSNLFITKKDMSAFVFANHRSSVFVRDLKYIAGNGTNTKEGRVYRLFINDAISENQVVGLSGDYSNIKLFFNDYSVTLDNVTFENNISTIDNFLSIYIKPDDFVFDKLYEYTIYADNYKEIRNKLDGKGYSYRVPNSGKDQEGSVVWMIKTFFLAISVILGLLLTLVCGVVLNRIFSSKKKDFAILRSLGAQKGFMAKIVQTELALLSLGASTISVALLYILALFVDIVKMIVSYNSILVMLVYFIFMQLFANIIARRFNRKLFKFSVLSVLKEDE